METPDPADLERSLSALLQQLQDVPRLPAEIARARRDFFGSDRPVYAQDVAAVTAALVRFGEWYALERESEVIGEVPLEGLQRRGQLPDDASFLQDSTAGVFLVERVDSRCIQVRDLQDRQVLDLAVRVGSLRCGDLLVGRLYPGPGGEYLPSPVLGVHKDGASIGRAFEADLRRLRPGRRLTQLELEHLLFRQWAHAAGDRSPLEHLEARLQAILDRGGEDTDATEISEALRQCPQPGPVMGPLMDRMALETEVDLEVLRRLILEIWNHHAAARAPGSAPAPIEPPAQRPRPSASPAESLGQSLARRIEEGLARREDIDDLFASVGEMLGEDLCEEAAEEEPGEDEHTDAGDLEPLVREFLWEDAGDTGPARDVLERLVALQREMPVPKSDIEYLETPDLLRLLLHIYLESPPDLRAPAVQSAFAVLEGFYHWAERTQEYELGGVIRGCHGLVEDVQRLHDASLLLSTGSARQPPCLMRVVELHENAVGVQVHGENGPVLATASAPALAALRTGDLLLGSIEILTRGPGSFAGMVVVVPEGLEQLLG